MAQPESIPHAHATTGKDRWVELVGRERARREQASEEGTRVLVRVEQIKAQMRSVVLFATINPTRTAPEYLDWSKDLRRGRTNILGGFFRLCDVLARRRLEGNEGRGYALKLLALARDYVDLILPEAPAPASIEAAPRLRIVRSGTTLRQKLTVARRVA